MAGKAFSGEDLVRLSENYNARHEMAKTLMELNNPDNYNLLNHILDSMDRSTLAAASIRVKEEDTRINEKMLNTVSEILKIKHMQDNANRTQPELEFDDAIEINPLELAEEPDALDIDSLYLSTSGNETVENDDEDYEDEEEEEDDG